MGFVFRDGSGGIGGGGSSPVVASVTPPEDITKFWLDLSDGRPVYRVYNAVSETWIISEGDINDGTIAENQTWSSQQIIETGYYTHTQSTPAASWVIDHDMGRMPAVTIMGVDGEQVFGDVDYISENQLVIDFSEPIEGKAYLT